MKGSMKAIGWEGGEGETVAWMVWKERRCKGRLNKGYFLFFFLSLLSLWKTLLGAGRKSLYLLNVSFHAFLCFSYFCFHFKTHIVHAHLGSWKPYRSRSWSLILSTISTDVKSNAYYVSQLPVYKQLPSWPWIYMLGVDIWNLIWPNKKNCCPERPLDSWESMRQKLVHNVICL